MSQDDKNREDHLHADQDEVAGKEEEPFSEQSGDSNVEPEGAGGSEHGLSASEPFGHDEAGAEPEVDPRGDEDEG